MSNPRKQPKFFDDITSYPVYDNDRSQNRGNRSQQRRGPQRPQRNNPSRSHQNYRSTRGGAPRGPRAPRSHNRVNRRYSENYNQQPETSYRYTPRPHYQQTKKKGNRKTKISIAHPNTPDAKRLKTWKSGAKPVYRPEHTPTTGIVINFSEGHYGFIRPIGSRFDIWFGAYHIPYGIYYERCVVNFKARTDPKGKQECYDVGLGPHGEWPTPMQIYETLKGTHLEIPMPVEETSTSTSTSTTKTSNMTNPPSSKVADGSKRRVRVGPVLKPLRSKKGVEKEEKEQKIDIIDPVWMNIGDKKSIDVKKSLSEDDSVITPDIEGFDEIYGRYPEPNTPTSAKDIGFSFSSLMRSESGPGIRSWESDDVDKESGEVVWADVAERDENHEEWLEKLIRAAEFGETFPKKFPKKFPKQIPAVKVSVKKVDDHHVCDNIDNDDNDDDDIDNDENENENEVEVSKGIDTLPPMPPQPTLSPSAESDLSKLEGDFTRNGIDKSTIPCRYHGSARGCVKGDECTYSHDDEFSVRLCQEWFENGKCSFGDDCRFRHKKAEPNEVPKIQKPKKQLTNDNGTTTSVLGEQSESIKVEKDKTTADNDNDDDDDENVYPEGLDETSITTSSSLMNRSKNVEEKRDVDTTTTVTSTSFDFAEQEIQRMAFDSTVTSARSWRAGSVSPPPARMSHRGIQKHDLRGWFSSGSSASRAH